jgi:hypothetical protein
MGTPDVIWASEVLRRMMQSNPPPACYAPPGGVGSYNDHGAPQGGVLGRLRDLDAEQNPDGPAATNDGTPSVPPDPNARYLVRTTPPDTAQGANATSLQPAYPIGTDGSGSQSVTPNAASVGTDGSASPQSPQMPDSIFDVLSALFGNEVEARRNKPKRELTGKAKEIMDRYEAGRKAREDARNAAGRAAFTDPDDPCTTQNKADMEDCHRRWPDYTEKTFYQACKDKAGERLAYCRKPNNTPPPKRWDESMEEIEFNHGR